MKPFLFFFAGFHFLPFAATDGHAQADYEADVAFALSEIESKCGHFFPAKEIDWTAVSARFSEEAKTIDSDQAHYVLLWRLLARLRDGHASVATTEKTKAIRWVEETPQAGMGIFLAKVEDEFVIKRSWGGAEVAGAKPGMTVSRIEGEPADEWITSRVERLSDTYGFSTHQQAWFFATHWGMTGPVGSDIEIEVKNGRRQSLAVNCREGTRQVPDGPAFFPKPEGAVRYGGNSDLHWCRLASDEGGFGYIHVRRCKGNLPEQMDQALADLAEVPGIILDWRGNSGGGFDHDALFGRFIPAGKSTSWGKSYQSAGSNPYGGPVVVIIDATVRSAGETGAGIFKEDGRGFVIGESPTAGMSSSKTQIELPSGLFTLRVSVHSNKARFNEGRGIEGVGVIPHERVEFEVDDLVKEKDTLILRAIELLEKGFPAGVVPYEPAQFGWVSPR